MAERLYYVNSAATPAAILTEWHSVRKNDPDTDTDPDTEVIANRGRGRIDR